MSDTPRTDAVVCSMASIDRLASSGRRCATMDELDLIAVTEHARQLERELAAAKESADTGAHAVAILARERDALRVSVEERIKAAQNALSELEDVAHGAISYVGAANYRERQESAYKRVSDCADRLRAALAQAKGEN